MDSIASPLAITIDDSNNHDCKLFNKVFDKMITNNDIKKEINKDPIILADKGYDTKSIKNIVDIMYPNSIV